MSLTKTQLIKAISSETGFSQKKISEIYAVLLDILTATLANGDIISIRGFGKFYLTDRKARKIRHPSNGQILIVEAKKTISFKCFKFLREEINGFEFDFEEFKRQNKIILQQLYDIIENSRDYEEEEREGTREKIF